MKFALVNNDRQEAAPDKRGICPVCGAVCIAKCGQFKINHWAHKSKKDCDSWWEPETLWHREWKNKFPKEWQEVIDYDSETGEKHIADIRTSNNLVIEFQHSSITPEEREAREKFHKAIIWVANIVIKREVKLFEFYPKNTTECFEMYEVDIPKKWFASKVPVLFDLSDLDSGIVTDYLYCMLPQVIDHRLKRFIKISKQDFIDKANSCELKKFLHDLMVEAKQEADKRKKLADLCDEIEDNIKILDNYSTNFRGVTKNWNKSGVTSTKGWRKIEGQWYIPSGANALLKVDAQQSCEYKQLFPICDSSVKSLIDYYKKITSVQDLIYTGRAYNGESCAGHAVAKYLDEEGQRLFIICKEANGAFVKKTYERDYKYYSGHAGFEWLKCPLVSSSFNLITVEVKNGTFVHSHEFELGNWIGMYGYDVLI